MSCRRQQLPFLAVVFLVVVGGMTEARAQLPNLTYKYDPSFQYPVMPTVSAPAPWPITLPATLPGNMNTIYVNFAGWNNGTAGTGSSFTCQYYVDGIPIDGASWSALLPGEGYGTWDDGPNTVRGGRHTMSVWHDDQNLVTESDETDNVFGRQYVFTPYVLSESTPKTRGAPEPYDGGWETIVDGSLLDANCDGFRFSSTGWWNAITMYTKDNTGYYNMELHDPSTGSEDGYFGYITISGTIEGWLDAIIVNRNVVGVRDYDIGVDNLNESDDQFVIEQVVSQPADVGFSTTVELGTDDYLRIWDTYVAPDDLGWVTVSVQDLDVDGQEFYVGWFDMTTATISLTDYAEWEITDELGRVRLHRNLTASGYYGVAIFRSPRDGRGPQTLQVDIERTPADLLPLHMPGWHSPLVPTPVPVAAGSPVTLPDTLHGFVPETFFNWSLENYGPALTPIVPVAIGMDGVGPRYVPTEAPMMTPFSAWSRYDVIGTPNEVPGGRHTLVLNLDYIDDIHEIYEDNNFFAEQFCWSPMELSLGWQHSRDYLGPAAGGYEFVAPGEIFHLNCDGYRFYNGYCEWEGVVLTQGPNSDYDLHLFDPLVGVKNGFDYTLANSILPAGQTDYILLNNNLLMAGVYDVGVVNRAGDEPYTIEIVGSTNLPVPNVPTHGPFEMGPTRMLHLYNIHLEEDLYAFRLDNLAGNVDWGFTLHQENQVLHVPNLSSPTSNLNGPGGYEMFTTYVATAGYYGLAVFKVGPSEHDKAGTYELTILQGVSDVPDEPDLPTVTALAGAHPNPFNPTTTISYDLAAAATVELKIYDLKGALVRRLVGGSMPAGRHEAVWNGRDESGSRVASGVYLARFGAGDHREVKKLVMVK